MPGTVYYCKKYFIVFFFSPVKITAYNRFGFEKIKESLNKFLKKSGLGSIAFCIRSA